MHKRAHLHTHVRITELLPCGLLPGICILGAWRRLLALMRLVMRDSASIDGGAGCAEEESKMTTCGLLARCTRVFRSNSMEQPQPVCRKRECVPLPSFRPRRGTSVQACSTSEQQPGDVLWRHFRPNFWRGPRHVHFDFYQHNGTNRIRQLGRMCEPRLKETRPQRRHSVGAGHCILINKGVCLLHSKRVTHSRGLCERTRLEY